MVDKQPWEEPAIKINQPFWSNLIPKVLKSPRVVGESAVAAEPEDLGAGEYPETPDKPLDTRPPLEQFMSLAKKDGGIKFSTPNKKIGEADTRLFYVGFNDKTGKYQVGELKQYFGEAAASYHPVDIDSKELEGKVSSLLSKITEKANKGTTEEKEQVSLFLVALANGDRDSVQGFMTFAMRSNPEQASDFNAEVDKFILAKSDEAQRMERAKAQCGKGGYDPTAMCTDKNGGYSISASATLNSGKGWGR